MKRKHTLFACALLAAALPLAPAFAEEPEVIPARVALNAEVGMATVQEVNQETRQVTLRAPDGSLSTFIAGDEVRNLAQVEAGDVVLVEYYQGLAVALEPGGSGIRERMESVELQRAEPGEKPGASLTTTIDVIARVEAVDSAARTVTLRGTERTVTLKVADDIDLAKVKVGDDVSARYVESFAVAVVPSPEVSGEVKIESKAVALGVGFEWGGGTLTMYDGSTHNFKLKGLSIVDIGVSSVKASGEVYRLTDPKDFAGTYVAGAAGGALGGGGSSIVMKNGKGVVMRLESEQKGLRLTLAPGGVSIESVE